MFNEKRTSARKVLKVKAKLVIDGCAPVTVRTNDIAASGMNLTVDEPYRTGATGLVSFDLFFEGKVSAISVRAKVVHCILSGNEFKLGVSFLNLDLGAMTTLAKFLR